MWLLNRRWLNVTCSKRTSILQAYKGQKVKKPTTTVGLWGQLIMINRCTVLIKGKGHQQDEDWTDHNYCFDAPV